MRFNALDGFRVGALCCPAGLAGCKPGYFGLPETGIGGNGGLVTRDGPADDESKYPDEFAECSTVVLGDKVTSDACRDASWYGLCTRLGLASERSRGEWMEAREGLLLGGYGESTGLRSDGDDAPDGLRNWEGTGGTGGMLSTG